MRKKTQAHRRPHASSCPTHAYRRSKAKQQPGKPKPQAVVAHFQIAGVRAITLHSQARLPHGRVTFEHELPLTSTSKTPVRPGERVGGRYRPSTALKNFTWDLDKWLLSKCEKDCVYFIQTTNEFPHNAGRNMFTTRPCNRALFASTRATREYDF